MRLYATVDFDAEPARLAKQSVEEFDAIGPIVRTIIHISKTGNVASLIETLRKKTGGQQDQFAKPSVAKTSE